MKRFSTALKALLIVSLAGLASPVSATIFMMVSDHELVSQAALVVDAEMLAEAPAALGTTPATDYQVAVHRTLKGDPFASRLTLRVPGGIAENGFGLKVWGAPRFAVGSRALLFLVPGPEDTYSLLHLMLGAFHRLDTPRGALAWRNLEEASEVRLGRDGGLETVADSLDLPRDAEAFANWIAAGAASSGNYFVSPDEGGVVSAVERFSFLTHTDGRRVRWFGFDFGQSIPWEIDSAGQAGLPGGGAAELQKALATWNNDPSSTILYTYRGTTAANVPGCAAPSAVARVVFNDPTDEIAGSFSCQGGVLAQGGPCFEVNPLVYHGVEYHSAVDAYFVTQDGLGCLFEGSSNPARTAEELFAHEVGHTLGLGHSSVGGALMNAFLHNDGRGASLHSDDRAAIAVAYGDGTVPPPPPPPPQKPAAPSELEAEALSSSRIRLTWRDNANNETGYRVEQQAYAGFAEVAQLAAGSTTLTLNGLPAASPFSFRVRAVNAQGFSLFSNTATSHTRGTTGPCVPSATTLCLQNGAVKVEVNWRTTQGGGTLGTGKAVPLGPKSGAFWFFAADNIELLVKALDGGAVNGHYWLFYGALSNVEYWVRVTQTATGEARVYHNPQGEICGVGDVTALDKSAILAVEGPPLQSPREVHACVAGPDSLCLLGGRFEVKVDWTNHHAGNVTGIGHPATSSDRTGYFWFFNAENLELVVKALDGRAVNGKYWFFYGALSDVAYRLRVRDTVTGATRFYDNPPGEICGKGDTSAFNP